MKPIKIITVEKVNGIEPGEVVPVYERNGKYFVVNNKLNFSESWIRMNSKKRRIIVVLECYG